MLSPSGDIHPVDHALPARLGRMQVSVPNASPMGLAKGRDWIAYAQTDARYVPRLVIYSMGISASQDPPLTLAESFGEIAHCNRKLRREIAIKENDTAVFQSPFVLTSTDVASSTQTAAWRSQPTESAHAVLFLCFIS